MCSWGNAIYTEFSCRFWFSLWHNWGTVHVLSYVCTTQLRIIHGCKHSCGRKQYLQHVRCDSIYPLCIVVLGAVGCGNNLDRDQTWSLFHHALLAHGCCTCLFCEYKISAALDWYPHYPPPAMPHVLSSRSPGHMTRLLLSSWTMVTL